MPPLAPKISARQHRKDVPARIARKYGSGTTMTEQTGEADQERKEGRQRKTFEPYKIEGPTRRLLFAASVRPGFSAGVGESKGLKRIVEDEPWIPGEDGVAKKPRARVGSSSSSSSLWSASQSPDADDEAQEQAQPQSTPSSSSSSETLVADKQKGSREADTKRNRSEIPASDEEDDALPDLEDLLRADSKTKERIQQIADRKARYRREIDSVPQYILQTHVLIRNEEDLDKLRRTEDTEQRISSELKMMKKALAVEKIRNMRLAGDIARWKALANRVQRGTKGCHEEWSGKQGAFNQLLGELMGTRIGDESDD